MMRHRTHWIVPSLLALVASVLAITSFTGARAVDATVGAAFHAISPYRLVNTANGTGGSSTALGPGETRSYTVVGQGPLPTTGIKAIMLDISATGLINASHSSLRLHASGSPRNDETSLLRIDPLHLPDSNSGIIPVGANGEISVYNSAGSAHFNIDVQGYFATPGSGTAGHGYVPVYPDRIVDSRDGTGMTAGRLLQGVAHDIQVTGASVPASATSVFANVKVFDAAVGGGLRVGPGGEGTTSQSSVNYSDSGFTDSGMIVRLSADGKIRLRNLTANSDINVTVDLLGYFVGVGEGSGYFTPLDQANIYDTSDTEKLLPGEARRVSVLGSAGVPDDNNVGSVAMTITASYWTESGSVKVYNSDLPPPATSNVSFSTSMDGSTGSASTAIVDIASDGTVTIKNFSSAPVSARLTAQGWFYRSGQYALNLNLSGTVYDTQQQAVADIPVSLAVQDYDNIRQTDQPWEIATGTTDAFGQYVLSSESCCADAASQASLEAAVQHYGALSVELIAMLPSGPVVSDFNVNALAAPTAAQAQTLFTSGAPANSSNLNLQENQGLVDAPVSPQSSYDATRSRTVGQAAPSESNVIQADFGSSSPTTGGETASLPSDGGGDSWQTCRPNWRLVWTNNQMRSREINVPVGAITTRAHLKGAFRYNTARMTELSVAITRVGGSGHLGGTVQSTRTRGTNIEKDYSNDYNNQYNNSLAATWSYSRRQAACVPPQWSTGNEQYYINRFKWIPYINTGGFDTKSINDNFSCNPLHDAKVVGRQTYYEARDVTWRGFFSIAGVEMNVTQGHSSHVAEIWRPRTSYGWICGKGDMPSQAGHSREIDIP